MLNNWGIFVLVLCASARFSQSASTKSMSGIPTNEEQADLLLNVKEIFEELKKMVQEEGKATDAAVVTDLNKIVERAQDKLELVEELALVKLSCKETNDVCVQSAKPKIQKLIQEGVTALEGCIQDASYQIMQTSTDVSNNTKRAMAKGQALLDVLSACSNKPTLQQIPCYKNIMFNDVVPVKLVLLESIGAHKEGHARAIEIRNEVNECVDEVMRMYQIKATQELADGLVCQMR